MSTASVAADLAGHVYDRMAEIARDDALSGFTVHRSSEDGTVAVTFRPGVVDAQVSVLRWELSGWAARLREAGFTVHVEASNERGAAGTPQWLRITGWQQPTGASSPGISPDVPLNILGIGGQVYGRLWRIGITTIGALAAYTPEELLDLRGIGSGTVAEVERFLAKHGYRLASETGDRATSHTAVYGDDPTTTDQKD